MRKSKNGFNLEKFLKTKLHKAYHQSGRALVRKVNHRIDRENEFVDFSGVIAGGRMVEFEAKQTESEAWQWTEVKAHQRRILCDVSAMGGIAFVYLVWCGTHYIIPPERIGRGRFKPELYEDCKLPVGRSWLDLFAES